LVTSYDLWPGNRAGLFSKEKASKKVDKEKTEQKKEVSGGSQVNKRTMHIVPKSSNESRVHYAPEPARGELQFTKQTAYR